MPAASFFIVIVACLAGQITCGELDPALKRCQDQDFEKPGYSPGCTYTCKNGSMEDTTEYWGEYRDATLCVALTNDNLTQFTHIGSCKNGKCVQYAEDNIQRVWSQLPELQSEFRNCDTISSNDSVENCLYICKTDLNGYSYGIYQDRSTCKVKNGGLGICLSGFCHGKEYFPTTDNDTLKLL
ncbi:uncharacterized protein LOC115329887 [Ixodes scapularis]|uniref:uncharacterized protein LOC115329887 n=1 Tax=Ixodes scapularis TaxID=6945 RepID=UPI001A9FB27F|nr:uncharacterized protein LOC115329887 [Ixodes scapularis]